MNTSDTITRSRYREFTPPPQLRDRLVCLWARTIAGGENHAQAVLPDGCVDIVWIGSSAPIVAGPATLPIVVELAGGTSVVGARFRPGWAAPSLGAPVDELLNTHEIPLADFGVGSAPVAGEGPPEDTLLKLRTLTRWALREYSDAQRADGAIWLAVQRLTSNDSHAVGTLERETGLSSRQLQRRFRAAVGYGPKTFQRIMRLQRLLWLASKDAGPRDLADFAAAVGYADQAHMCREVRDLTQVTPQALLARPDSTVAVSDLFNTEEQGTVSVSPRITRRGTHETPHNHPDPGRG